MKKNILKNESIVSFFLAIMGCIVLLAFCNVLPGQDYVLLNDSSREVIPFIRMFYRHLLKGESLYYTWDIGLGVSTSVTYAFYVLSPVNLIVLLFKNNDVALVMLMVAKTGLSALLMSVFLKKCTRCCSCWNIAFSILYAFSNYQFMMFQNICLSDVVWLLPLLITSVFMFVKGKISLFQLSVCYALCFVTQFYAGFLTGIYSMFFLLGLLIFRKNEMSSAKIRRLILKWILAVFAALSVSMLFLWPMLVTYFTNGGSAWNSFEIDRKIDLFAFVSSVLWGRGNIWCEETPTLYCGIITILLMPLYFTDKRIGKKEKILFIIALAALTISFFAEPVYEFWHLFNRPDGYTSRFSILYLFTCITIAGREKAFSGSDEEQTAERKIRNNKRIYEVSVVIMLVIVAGLYIYWSVTGQESFAHPLRMLAGNIGFIIAWLSTDMLMRGRRKPAGKYIVVLIAMAEAVTAGYYPVKESGKRNSDNAIMIADRMLAATDVILNDSDKFYRANISGADINQGAVYGFNGVSIFSSENYGDLLFTMFRLGDCVTPFSFSQTGGTDFTDMLFGVKYRGNIESDMYLNENVLPIGFAVSDEIFDLKKENSGIDPFEEQNALASALCEDVEVYKILDDISYQTYNMSCYMSDDRTGIMVNQIKDEPGGMIVSSKDKGYKHAYAFVSKISSEEDDAVGIMKKTLGGDIVLCSDKDRYGDGIRNLAIAPAIIEMDTGEEGHRLRIIDYDDPQYDFSFAKLCLYGQDDEAIDRIYNELNSNKFNLEIVTPGYITGNIDIPTNKNVLFLTVPYDRCWNAWIDGQKVEIKKAVFDSFCALSVSTGSHDVMLKYEPPGAWMKWFFFMIGFTVWISLIVKWRGNGENK